MLVFCFQCRLYCQKIWLKALPHCFSLKENLDRNLLSSLLVNPVFIFILSSCFSIQLVIVPLIYQNFTITSRFEVVLHDASLRISFCSCFTMAACFLAIVALLHVSSSSFSSFLVRLIFQAQVCLFFNVILFPFFLFISLSPSLF